MQPFRAFRSILTVGFGFLLLGAASAAHGYPVLIDITARVRWVDDFDGYLGGAVQAGDMVQGRYAYESTTLDSNPAPTVGDYCCYAAPYGISLQVGGFSFRTDPGNVDFLVEIANDHGSPHPMDGYLLRSSHNLFDVSVPDDGSLDNQIWWQLDDETCGALSCTDLPTTPPVLSAWPADRSNGLDIVSLSHSAQFDVRADVTKAILVPNPVPEPASLTLLVLGLGSGVGWRLVKRSRRRAGA
jgi:hypothetical protein